MNSYNKHNTCIVCNSTNLVDMRGYERAYLCKCSDCGMVFTKRVPTSEELNAYYKDYGVNNYLSPLTIKRYNELLDRLEPYKKTKRILDVGCGVGYFLEEAKKRGWEVYGTELSKESAKICVQKGIKMQEGILDSKNFESGMFDVITSFEVIEHINNPQSELENFNNLLRKGGLVYITTPNFNSLLRLKLKSSYNVIAYPEHLSYYTPKSITTVFKLCGFAKLKVDTTGISMTRFKTSKGTSKQKIISAKSDDELIRNKIDNKKSLMFAKRIVNSTLTALGRGDTIKGWFVKL